MLFSYPSLDRVQAVSQALVFRDMSLAWLPFWGCWIRDESSVARGHCCMVCPDQHSGLFRDRGDNSIKGHNICIGIFSAQTHTLHPQTMQERCTARQSCRLLSTALFSSLPVWCMSPDLPPVFNRAQVPLAEPPTLATKGLPLP